MPGSTGGAGGRRTSSPAALAGGGGTTAAAARKAYRDVPSDAHEWVSFEDPEEARRWVFDVTFLLSGWQCIYGRGCQGVLTGPAEEMVQGCCSYGAHFTDDDDVARVLKAAQTLTDDQWQFAATGRRRGVVRTQADGVRVTRMVDGACVFLNRPEFPGGPGCALHRAALEQGVAPLELKPDVCWQLPLRREDTSDDAGWVTSTVTQWDRRHWGDGGEEFHWWCTEAPEAFRARQPVYVDPPAGADRHGGRGRVRPPGRLSRRRGKPPASRSPIPSAPAPRLAAPDGRRVVSALRVPRLRPDGVPGRSTPRPRRPPWPGTTTRDHPRALRHTRRRARRSLR